MSLIISILILSLISSWYCINGFYIKCLVRPMILRKVPDSIIGTIAIANSSGEEIFWDYVYLKPGVQFPLNFTVVINNYNIINDSYTIQLHIYKFPRVDYDLPLWSADTSLILPQTNQDNFIQLIAQNDRKPNGPCILGIIMDLNSNDIQLSGYKLTVQVGSMSLITFEIYSGSLPFLFMIPDIPETITRNSTIVSIELSKFIPSIKYLAKQMAIFNNNNSDYTVVVFQLSRENSTKLTITTSATVFTSISLFTLAVTYRIFQSGFLFYEKTEIINTLQFPFITSNMLIPISTSGNYNIEATIYGPGQGITSGMTLFQGVTNTRLIASRNNTVKISMLYTGLKIGTTIIGTIRQASSSIGTWPLIGSNLAFTLDDQTTGLDEANQFIIFDQTFPIEFTIFNLQSINGSNQNVVFTVTITYIDGTVIWEATTINNQISYNRLNRLDINVTIADGYRCQSPGNGWCSLSSLNKNVNTTCCSQYKCAGGECAAP